MQTTMPLAKGHIVTFIERSRDGRATIMAIFGGLLVILLNVVSGGR